MSASEHNQVRALLILPWRPTWPTPTILPGRRRSPEFAARFVPGDPDVGDSPRGYSERCLPHVALERELAIRFDVDRKRIALLHRFDRPAVPEHRMKSPFAGCCSPMPSQISLTSRVGSCSVGNTVRNSSRRWYSIDNGRLENSETPSRLSGIPRDAAAHTHTHRRHARSGSVHCSPVKREKSASHEFSSAPCSIASAARCASVTMFPAVPSGARSSRRIAA